MNAHYIILESLLLNKNLLRKTVLSKLVFITLVIVNLMFFNSTVAMELEHISKIFKDNPIQANFEQSKHILGLSSPLRTKGQIWMSKSNQLIWQVTYPIKSTLVINKYGVTQYDSADKKIQQSNNAYSSEISSMFLNIVKGDFQTLQKRFDIACDCLALNWTLTLLPKEVALKKVLEKITIHGVTQLDGFSYKEINGDETLIKLKPTKTELSQQLQQFLDLN